MRKPVSVVEKNDVFKRKLMISELLFDNQMKMIIDLVNKMNLFLFNLFKLQ